MGSIRCREAKLFIDFRYLNQRCREQTQLPDTKPNRKKLEQALKIIEGEIAKGTFEYARYFPNSKKLAKLQKLEAQMKANYRQSPVFSEFAEIWYSEFEHTWRRATAKTYRAYLNNRLIPAFGEIEVSQITKADLIKERSAIAKFSNGSLKAKTINKFFRCMGMLMNEAADRYDFTSPFQNFKPLKEEKVHIEPFSIAEVNKILANVRADWHCYLLVRLFTGIRTGEAVGLKWKYVDFDKRQILIRETYSENHWEYTKNDGSQREVDMSSMVYEALLLHYQKRTQNDLVFPVSNGQPIHAGNFLKRIWKPLLSHLRIPYRKPYQMRHTAATLWLAAGENPSWIANQMGHASTQMLFTVYARYVPNLTHKDGSAMEKLLAQQVDGFHQLHPATAPADMTLSIDDSEEQAIEAESSFWDSIIQPDARAHH